MFHVEYRHAESHTAPTLQATNLIAIIRAIYLVYNRVVDIMYISANYLIPRQDRVDSKKPKIFQQATDEKGEFPQNYKREKLLGITE